MTFATDIEEAAGGEPIESIVIGGFGWGDIEDEPGEAYHEHDSVPKDKRGIVLSWAEARPLLDYDYDTGYGAPDCHAVYVWTAASVIYVVQYDGSTRLSSIPRNPVDCVPDMPGG